MGVSSSSNHRVYIDFMSSIRHTTFHQTLNVSWLMYLLFRLAQFSCPSRHEAQIKRHSIVKQHFRDVGAGIETTRLSQDASRREPSYPKSGHLIVTHDSGSSMYPSFCSSEAGCVAYYRRNLSKACRKTFSGHVLFCIHLSTYICSHAYAYAHAYI